MLLEVQDLLDPGAGPADRLGSVESLVEFAVGEGWLDLLDVVGGPEAEEEPESVTGETVEAQEGAPSPQKKAVRVRKQTSKRC